MTSAQSKVRNAIGVNVQKRTGATNGVTIMANARAHSPTTVASKTLVGESEIRECVSAILIRFPTKSIQTATQLTDEGVRLLKNQRRTPSTATLINLAKARGELGPAIWEAICDLCDRPTGFPEPIVIEPIVLDAWKLQDLREERAREIEERKIGAIHDLFEPRRRA